MATALQIYLQDHLAGATFGLELVERSRRNNEGTELGDRLQELAVEIRADREALEAVMSAAGADRSHLKTSAAWALEKVGRLKPNGRVRGYTALGRLLELEALVVGITGKRALWRGLQDSLAQVPSLQAFDFAALAERAENQLGRVEQLRLDAARAVIG